METLMLVSGGAAAVFVGFVLRTRLPAVAVLILLAGAGAVLALGAVLLQPDPSTAEAAFAAGFMALLVPFHIRSLLGPFGPRTSSDRAAKTGA